MKPGHWLGVVLCVHFIENLKADWIYSTKRMMTQSYGWKPQRLQRSRNEWTSLMVGWWKWQTFFKPYSNNCRNCCSRKVEEDPRGKIVAVVVTFYCKICRGWKHTFYFVIVFFLASTQKLWRSWPVCIFWMNRVRQVGCLVGGLMKFSAKIWK